MAVLTFRRKSALRLVTPGDENFVPPTPPPPSPPVHASHPRCLFIDGFLDPIDVYPDKPLMVWHVCRSCADAMDYVEKHGIPEFVSSAFILKRETLKEFLVWLVDVYKPKSLPTVSCHESGNQEGSMLILSIFAAYQQRITT